MIEYIKNVPETCKSIAIGQFVGEDCMCDHLGHSNGQFGSLRIGGTAKCGQQMSFFHNFK